MSDLIPGISRKNRIRQYLEGVKAGLPVLFGFLPVGIAYALMARRAGFSAFETVLMSVMVFGGASQMMAIGMFTQGASVIAMILATFILNLRHLIMSTCVEDRLKNEKLPLRLLAASGVTDESFAIFTARDRNRYAIRFFLGLSAVTYVSWILGSAVGAFTADLLPPLISKSLGIALYALFIGLLVPGLKHNIRLVLLVIMAGVLNTLLRCFIPASWALILATLLSAGAGVFFIDSGKDEEVKDHEL